MWQRKGEQDNTTQDHHKDRRSDRLRRLPEKTAKIHCPSTDQDHEVTDDDSWADYIFRPLS